MSEQEYRELLAAKDRRIAELEALLAKALARIADLEARVGQNSKNSSRPPSSDPPSVPPNTQTPTGRKPGGQKGHKWWKKELLPLEKVSQIVSCSPPFCRHCKEPLFGSDPSPLRHQVAELPVIHPLVTEYQLHQLCCPTCHKTTRARLPLGVPEGDCGPRLLSLIALLSCQYHLSKSLIHKLLSSILQIAISIGTISNAEELASQAVAKPVAELQKEIVNQPQIYMDETGWKNKGKKLWLWTLVTQFLTLVSIRKSRCADEAKELLGEGTFETLITDRYNGYSWVRVGSRQICWAHLLRNFRALKERGGEDGELGRLLEEEGEKLFKLWHRFKEGKLSRREFQEEMMQIKHWVGLYIWLGAFSRPVKCRKLFKELWKVESAMWTFAWKENVEPTNNTAERALRQPVIYRKICQGTQSERGNLFVSHLLTVIITLKQQGRNALDYMTIALQASFSKTNSPSLLSGY